MGAHTDPNGIRYASRTARVLAWLVYLPPFNWIAQMQSNVATEGLKQIFGEYDAQPITLSLIARGRPQSSLPLAIPSGLDESK
jgi:hypothetical protein